MGRAGVAVGPVVENGGQLPVPEEVGAVVRGHAVGAQAHVDPALPMAGTGAMPLPSLRLLMGLWMAETPWTP